MLILDDNLVERVAGIIPRYNMLGAGMRVGVAVSGGADSVVLLHVLNLLAGRFGFEFSVLHVNHCLRGAESDGDEDFVRDLAQRFGLAFVFQKSELRGGNLEQEARDARRAFFQKCAQQHTLDRIALGHTQTDQAETVLFRMLRGSGSAGLAGMRPVTADGLIRPLLTISRSEVRRWAQQHAILWREDSSNVNNRFTRNKIRNELLPLLEELNPAFEGNLARAAGVAQAEEEYWDRIIEPLYERISTNGTLGSFLNVPSILDLDLAVRRRLSRRALAGVRGNLRGVDVEHVDSVLRICESLHGHDRVILPGVDALRSFECLLLTQPGEIAAQDRNYSVPLKVGETCQLPFGAGVLSLTRTGPGSENCANFKEDQGLSAEWVDFNAALLRLDRDAVGLSVRNWQPGDQLHRLGHTKPEKIKSLFHEQGIYLWQRRHWPVVVSGDEIVWVRQFGVNAKFLAQADSLERLRIEFRTDAY
jgi:tRNA(Ile)-lysidine synthase